MPTPLVELEDLFASMFKEAELRRFIGRLGDGEVLARSLPGGMADLATLAFETTGLLKRRGRVDRVLFEALAAQAGADRAEVARVAGLWGHVLPVSATAGDGAAPVLTAIQRYDVLKRLLPALFDEILFRTGAPTASLPASTAPQATRALGLVEWLDSQTDQTRRSFDALLRAKAPGLFE